MSVTMKTQPKLAILALSLFLAAGSAQAITLGIGSGKQVVAPTVVHSDSATEDSEADKDAGNYGPDTVAEKNTDPLEGLNRAVYSLNKGLDKAILKPVATVYTNVVPSLARQGVNNFLSYLHTPLDVLNYALQGNGERAGNAMGRFMLNTFGFGVFDLATDMGISRKQTGFGETFGVWGAPQGPYVVLPVFGGRSLRGTVGTFGDAQLGVVGQLKTDEQTAAIVLDTLDTRSRLLGTENLVSEAALDEYSFVRDALLQREKNRVEELKE